MFYKGRELRRLWEVEVFDGPPEEDTPSHKETVIAWNAVDANQRCGGHVKSRPVALYFVTWPEAGEKPMRIDSTAGPTDEVVEPSIGNEDDWDF